MIVHSKNGVQGHHIIITMVGSPGYISLVPRKKVAHNARLAGHCLSNVPAGVPLYLPWRIVACWSPVSPVPDCVWGASDRECLEDAALGKAKCS